MSGLWLAIVQNDSPLDVKEEKEIGGLRARLDEIERHFDKTLQLRVEKMVKKLEDKFKGK